MLSLYAEAPQNPAISRQDAGSYAGRVQRALCVVTHNLIAEITKKLEPFWSTSTTGDLIPPR